MPSCNESPLRVPAELVQRINPDGSGMVILREDLIRLVKEHIAATSGPNDTDHAGGPTTDQPAEPDAASRASVGSANSVSVCGERKLTRDDVLGRWTSPHGCYTVVKGTNVPGKEVQVIFAEFGTHPKSLEGTWA